MGLGGALIYMTVTGLANTAPILPGNAALYQGAAVGALAMVGHAGATAIAASLVMPVMASVITACAALSGSRSTDGLRWCCRARWPLPGASRKGGGRFQPWSVEAPG